MLPRIVMIDRDGTLHARCPDKRYLAGEDPILLLPGVASCLRAMQRTGVVVAVCSNQQGVALDEWPTITPTSVARFHDRLNGELVAQGVQPLRFFVCPHTVADACGCRKPQPGLLYDAMRATNTRLPQAWFIGDSHSDVLAALRAGVQPIHLAGADVETVQQETLVAGNWQSIERLFAMGAGGVTRAAPPGVCEQTTAFQLNARAYDEVAEEYAAKTARFRGTERKVLERLLDERLRGLEVKVAVDLGCGPSRDAALYAQRGWFYIGADSSSKMLVKSVAQCRQLESLRWALACGDFLMLDLPPNSVGCVVANSSIQHVDREVLPVFLDSIANWLVTGGALYLHFRIGHGARVEETFEYPGQGGEKRGIRRYFVYYQAQEISDMLHLAGFEVVECAEYCTDYERDDLRKKEMVPTKARVVALRKG